MYDGAGTQFAPSAEPSAPAPSPEPSDREQAATRPIYVFPHVPKCAGTTICGYARSALGEGSSLMVDRHVQRRLMAAAPDQRAAKMADLNFVGGHYVPRTLVEAAPGREIRETALIRDPVGYAVSLYDFNRRRTRRTRRADMPFDAWYACLPANPIATFLLSRYFGLSPLRRILMSEQAQFDYLSERLRRFWFIGSHHRCGELIGRMAQDLGTPAAYQSLNVAPAVSLIRNRMRGRIRRDNALDQALFDMFGARSFGHLRPDLSERHGLRRQVAIGAARAVRRLKY